MVGWRGVSNDWVCPDSSYDRGMEENDERGRDGRGGEGGGERGAEGLREGGVGGGGGGVQGNELYQRFVSPILLIDWVWAVFVLANRVHDLRHRQGVWAKRESNWEEKNKEKLWVKKKEKSDKGRGREIEP